MHVNMKSNPPFFLLMKHTAADRSPKYKGGVITVGETGDLAFTRTLKEVI